MNGRKVNLDPNEFALWGDLRFSSLEAVERARIINEQAAEIREKYRRARE